jgi:hypothetical protein
MHMCFVFGHIGNGWRGRTRFRSDTHGRTTDTPPGGPDTPPTHHRHTPDTPPDAQQVFKPVGAHHRVYTGSRSVYTVSPPTPVSTPCPRKWLVYNVSRMVVLPMCLLRVWGRRVRLQSVSWGGLRLRCVSDMSFFGNGDKTVRKTYTRISTFLRSRVPQNVVDTVGCVQTQPGSL